MSSGGDEMVYTVQQLATLAGVTARTLRYYDSIDLLKPATTNESGYREYGANEVNRLQEILYYKALDIPLQTIKELLAKSEDKRIETLESQLKSLLKKQALLNGLVESIQHSIEDARGRIKMSDHDKFEALKKTKLDENEATYGSELRELYGEDAIGESNALFLEQSSETFEAVTQLEIEILNLLLEAFKANDRSEETCKILGDMHKKWLCFYWKNYSKQAHLGLSKTYVLDERFKAYYDQHAEGLAEYFSDLLEDYLT